MTGGKHNQEGNSSDRGEPDPGPYWRRMHRDWRFWIGAVLMAGALTIYVLSGDLAWSQTGIGSLRCQRLLRIEHGFPYRAVAVLLRWVEPWHS